MYLVTRLLPASIATACVVLYELAFAHPERYVTTLVLQLLVVTVGGILLLRRVTNAERLTLTFLPVVFLAGVSALGFFLSFGWFRHAIVIVACLAVWLLFEEIYRYVYEPEHYHRHAIEHLAGFLGVAGLAAAIAAIFAVRIFLNTRLILLLPMTLGISTLISAIVLAAQPSSRARLWSSSVLFGLFVTELAGAVNFLPSHYWVNALLVAVPYYVAIHLVRHELNDSLTPDRIRRYSLVGIAALIIVTTTAQWIL